jgi:hypothetical protein
MYIILSHFVFVEKDFSILKRILISITHTQKKKVFLQKKKKNQNKTNKYLYIYVSNWWNECDWR